MIISLSGKPGSGKTTIAKKLAKKLNWKYFDMGKVRRLKAKSLGLSLAEYNKIGEKDPQTDLELDQYQTKLGRTSDNFVIQGRTSWRFIPHSIKIYLDVNAQAGAQRVFKELRIKDNRNEDKNLHTIKDVLTSQRRRVASDTKRYQKYYGINVYDKKNYDYCLNTANLTEKQVFTKVYDYVKSRLKTVDKK